MKYKLYHGTSPYLSLSAVHTYIDDLVKKTPSISPTLLEADSLNARDIIDSLSSQSLFVSKRVILIKRMYRNKEKGALIEKVMEILKEGESKDILIIWEDQKIKSNTKYYKFFKEEKAIEEIESLNKRTFLTWLRKELDISGLKIEPTAIKELAERTNYDPERCSNEIKKFKLSTDSKIIRKEDIDQLIVDTLEKDIWDLTDAINEGNKVASMKILERLEKQFVDVNYIISMLARNLRLVTLTKSLHEEGKDYREISSILHIPPFTTPSLVRSSRKYTEERISKLYSKLSNLDYQIKSGKIDGNLGLTLICPYL